ncbi:hypothetical protein EVAR_49587_1 [Eumeta japonica]|uniref:Uncharacterized protein n=1 Tax=Eumeta variegata TaxID=151549 RepID=A0A4C1ZRH3_EUMVA|nr:hypothetical protein EVAR_49587_1 [Eumeta japonica]
MGRGRYSTSDVGGLSCRILDGLLKRVNIGIAASPKRGSTSAAQEWGAGPRSSRVDVKHIREHTHIT